MAKVKLNPVLVQFRGKIGDLVFKHYGDEVVVSRNPDRSGLRVSEAQLAQQERFREATLYGKMVMADPEAKAKYDAVAQSMGMPVFALTIADYFNAALQNLFKSVQDSLMFGSWFYERCLIPGLTCSPQA
jgi:hypothetical protein